MRNAKVTPSGIPPLTKPDREIGVYDPHYGTDGEQQDEYLKAVVDEKVECAAEARSGVNAERVVHKPVGKSLNHAFKIYMVA